MLNVKTATEMNLIKLQEKNETLALQQNNSANIANHCTFVFTWIYDYGAL